MMWRLVLAISLMLPGFALAQTVTAQSGEHEGFSRIALTFPATVDWQFGRTPDGYELRVAGPRPRYDLTTVFTFIPRDRLDAIGTDPATGTLRLTVRCACHATAFALRPEILVIDIVDGPPVPGSGFEMSLDRPSGQPLPPLAGSVAARPRPRPGATPEDASEATGADRSLALVTAPRLAPVLPDPARIAPAVATPLPLLVQDPRTDGLQQRLLLELGRAASRGVVDPVRRMPQPAPGAAAPTILPLPQAAGAAPVPDRGQLRVLPGPDPVAGDLTATGALCLADKVVDVAGWGDDRPLPEQISVARQGILGEFDVPDATAVLALARLYIYAGFGAEARNILETLAPGAVDASRIAVMAAVLDGDAPGAAFEGMEVCDGAVALWAVLARTPLRPGDRYDRGAIARTFSGLPLHLRRHLGPGLAERLLGAGDQTTAQSIRDAINRAPGDHGEALKMIEARIDLDRGEIAAGEDRLGDVVAGDGPMSPDALLTLANSVLGRGAALEPDMLIALEATEREHRATGSGPALRLALARALAVAGDYDRAFGEFALQTPEIAAGVWPILAERGTDPAILRHAVTPSNTAPASARLHLADRMLAIGFPDIARGWIGDDNSTAGRLLDARALLDLRDARGALRTLAGLDGAEADRLRVRAYLMLDDPEPALALLETSGPPEAAARAAWHAQAWQRLATTQPSSLDAPIARAVATLVLHESDAGVSGGPPDVGSTAEPPVGPLARSRALLAASDETRATIADLLAGVMPPTAD